MSTQRRCLGIGVLGAVAAGVVLSAHAQGDAELVTGGQLPALHVPPRKP